MKYFKRLFVIVSIFIFASLFIKVFATTTIDIGITTGAIVGTSLSITSDSNQIKLGASSDAGLLRSVAGVLKITNGSTGYVAIDTSQLKLNGTDILGTGNMWTADQTFGDVVSKDRIIISPVAKGSDQFDGTITSADLSGPITWTLPSFSGHIQNSNTWTNTQTFSSNIEATGMCLQAGRFLFMVRASILP